MFGGKLLRVDIPIKDADPVTEFYGCSAVYALRPCTEQIARDFVARAYDDPRPIKPVDYKPAETARRLGAPPGERPEEGDDDTNEYEDDEAA